MTRDQLLAKMKALRLSDEVVTWAQFASAVQGLTTAQKNSLMASLNSGNADAVGRALVNIVTDIRRAQASTYVDAKAADDMWTTDELLELLE